MENMALSLLQTVGLVGWCSLPWSLENEDRAVSVTSTLLSRARSLASSDVLAIWWCWLIMRFIVQAGILLTVGITHGQQRPSRLMGGGERPGSDGTARGRAGSRGRRRLLSGLFATSFLARFFRTQISHGLYFSSL